MKNVIMSNRFVLISIIYIDNCIFDHKTGINIHGKYLIHNFLFN